MHVKIMEKKYGYREKERVKESEAKQREERKEQKDRKTGYRTEMQ